MKKNSFLVMAIAVCCAVTFSCTSDFEDEAVVPAAKRTAAQAWSPGVLQCARELGIIIVDEDRQWNNLTDEDVVFYLNLLTEKGDSAFLPADTPVTKPMGMLRRLGSNTVEDVGSTVHDKTYCVTIEKEHGKIKYKIFVSIKWTVNSGVASEIVKNYNAYCVNTNCYRSHLSAQMEVVPKGENVDYRIKGTLMVDLYKESGENQSGKIKEYDDVETINVPIDEKGTAS